MKAMFLLLTIIKEKREKLKKDIIIHQNKQ